ncbi:MAG: DUF2185 domain-containing protein [Negativibacillus sp.]
MKQDISQETKDILQGIEQFWREVNTLPEADIQMPDKRRFILLLGGLSSYRKVPGVEEHMGFDGLYHCKGRNAVRETRDYLEKIMGVTDKESLLQTANGFYHSGDEYDQFLSFWERRPLFNEKDLTAEGRGAFQKCKAFAELFRPLVENRGFYAWDCNERICLYRAACACELISEDEFWNLTEPLARKACQLYHSWKEYALSALCGAVYFMYCQYGCKEGEELKQFYAINNMLLHKLFLNDGHWTRWGWYQFPVKNWVIPGPQIKPILTDWQGPVGCLATDRIMVDGCKVGYLYRVEAVNAGDSGWRFFAGDEDDAYTSDPDKVGVFHLNTLCNYDPSILPLLNAPVGTAFIRDEEGNFRREELEP